MISLTSHVHHYRFLSAIFSLIALTFRQTNVIIVAYEIGWTLIEEFRAKNKQSHIFHVYTCRASDTIDTKEYFTVLWKYGRQEIHLILQTMRSVLWQCRYQFLVILLFLILFIRNNFSITLGHQEHHQMVLHLAQMHYYAVYTAFFVSAHLVSRFDLNRREKEKNRIDKKTGSGSSYQDESHASRYATRLTCSSWSRHEQNF